MPVLACIDLPRWSQRDDDARDGSGLDTDDARHAASWPRAKRDVDVAARLAGGQRHIPGVGKARAAAGYHDMNTAGRPSSDGASSGAP